MIQLCNSKHRITFLLDAIFNLFEAITESREHLLHVASLLHGDNTSVVLLVYLGGGGGGERGRGKEKYGGVRIGRKASALIHVFRLSS